MFVIPAQAFKSRRVHVVILNDAAWLIIETQRGKHPVWVFFYRGERVERMDNTGSAPVAKLIPDVRVYDLRHTFAIRLRAAGSEEDRFASRYLLTCEALSTTQEVYAFTVFERVLPAARLRHSP